MLRRFVCRIMLHNYMSQGVALSIVVMRLQVLTTQGSENHTDNQTPLSRTQPLGLDAVAAAKVYDLCTRYRARADDL